MSIIRITTERTTPYVMLNTEMLNDPRLSFRAKGLHTYIMAKPDDWQGSIEILTQESQEGRKAIRSAIEELEAAGYARLKRHRGMGGTLAGWDLLISDTPDLAEDESTDDIDALKKRINVLKSLIPTDHFISGYVYILQAGPYFKIGKAQIADHRIVTLTIQLPFKVEPIHLMGCERYQEAEDFWHRRFHSKRTNGEWFLLDEQERQEIQAVLYFHALT